MHAGCGCAARCATANPHHHRSLRPTCRQWVMLCIRPRRTSSERLPSCGPAATQTSSHSWWVWGMSRVGGWRESGLAEHRPASLLPAVPAVPAGCQPAAGQDNADHRVLRWRQPVAQPEGREGRLESPREEGGWVVQRGMVVGGLPWQVGSPPALVSFVAAQPALVSFVAGWRVGLLVLSAFSRAAPAGAVWVAEGWCLRQLTPRLPLPPADCSGHRPRPVLPPLPTHHPLRPGGCWGMVHCSTTLGPGMGYWLHALLPQPNCASHHLVSLCCASAHVQKSPNILLAR